MKFLTALMFMMLSLFATAPIFATDYAALASQYLAKLEQGIASAKEHADAPQWWGQCEIDFKGLEENTDQLPPAQRAPFLAKIQLYRPQVEAGVRLYHASIVARHIRDALDSAQEDLKTGPVADRTLEVLARFFADKDLQGHPPDQLKKLRAEYEDVKRRSAGK